MDGPAASGASFDGWDLVDLDRVAARATPALDEVVIDGWLVKSSPGVPFRRANTIVPPADAAADRRRFDASLTSIRSWCSAHDQRCLVLVSAALEGHDDVDRWLAEAGLVVEAPVDLLVCDLSDRPEASSTDLVPVEVRRVDGHRGALAGPLVGATDDQAERAGAYQRLLAPLGDRAVAATTMAGADVVGTGFAVVDGTWVGLFGMVTSTEHRRCGIATAMVRALLDAAWQRGARRAYLQVETANAAGHALYGRLGFRRSHGYHYRADPQGTSPGC